MLDLDFSSHSTAHLKIETIGGKSHVLKTYLNGLERAKKCVAKQSQFPELFKGSIKISAAPVEKFDLHADLAILRMKYVEGLSGLDFAVHGTKNLAAYLSDAFSELLRREMGQSFVEQIDKELFLAKLEQIKSSVQSATLLDLLAKLHQKISALPNLISIPMGRCHGDLTLSNIIFNPLDGLVLIDFLDVFIETPLQDVAKINQDFIFGWSFRDSSESMRVKSKLFCKAAYPLYIKELFLEYGDQIELLTLFSLARIAPYVRDLQTESWLVAQLNCYLEAKGGAVRNFLALING